MQFTLLDQHSCLKVFLFALEYSLLMMLNLTVIRHFSVQNVSQYIMGSVKEEDCERWKGGCPDCVHQSAIIPQDTKFENAVLSLSPSLTISLSHFVFQVCLILLQRQLTSFYDKGTDSPYSSSFTCPLYPKTTHLDPSLTVQTMWHF